MSKSSKRAAKAERTPDDKRLLKALEKEEAPTGPLVTSPLLFGFIKELVESHLARNQYSQSAREHVARFGFAFRQEALKRFKHDTIETFQLAELLKEKTAAKTQIRVDALSHIARTSGLETDQQEAADYIREVWQAFGKGLSGAGRDLSRVGGSGVILHPLDTMDEDLWKHYKEIYSPWYSHVLRLFIPHGKSGTGITIGSLVFRILVEDIYPEQLDATYGFKKGTAAVLCKRALRYYWDPIKLVRSFAKNAEGAANPLGLSPAPESAPKARKEP